MIKERSLFILNQIIYDYIEGGKPVGSRTIAKNSKLNLSPASIRNVMSDLEENGYLYQPHISSGRVPTTKALKLYVFHILQERKNEQERLLGHTFFPNFENEAELMEHISESLGNKTQQTSFVTFSKKILVGCQSHILNQPEFNNIEQVKNIFSALEEKENLLQSIDHFGKGLQIKIGDENKIHGLEECSLVSSSYENVNGTEGVVGIIGPLRMNYSYMIDAVTSAAQTLTKKVCKTL